MGSAFDDIKYPTGCVDPAALERPAITCVPTRELRENLQNFITDNGTPKGMNTIYYVLTPPGVTVCLDAGATHCSDYSGGKEARSGLGQQLLQLSRRHRPRRRRPG